MASTKASKTASHFPFVPTIRFEGPESDNPFCFRFYDADRVVEGRPMR